MEPPNPREFAVTNATRWVSRKTTATRILLVFQNTTIWNSAQWISQNFSQALLTSYHNFTWLGHQSGATKVEKGLLLAESGKAALSSALRSAVSTQRKPLYLPTHSGSVYAATPSVCMWQTETFLRPELLPWLVISFTSSRGVAAAPWMKTVSPGIKPYVSGW